MTGIPSGRFFPLALLMYTRLTGLGLCEASWRCTESAKAAFPGR